MRLGSVPGAWCLVKVEKAKLPPELVSAFARRADKRIALILSWRRRRKRNIIRKIANPRKANPSAPPTPTPIFAPVLIDFDAAAAAMTGVLVEVCEAVVDTLASAGNDKSAKGDWKSIAMGEG